MAVGEVLAAAVISVMLASGRALEAWAAERAQRNLRALLARAPRTTRRYREGSPETVPLERIVPGDVLMVAPVLTRALLRRGEFTSRADLAGKITSFAIRYNRTAKPWTWAYDAGADHARHLARHARHDDSMAARPATASALPAAA